MSTTDRILSTLKSKGDAMKAGEIADATGIDKKEVDKAIKSLVADGVLHSPKRCFYAPK